MTGKDKQRLSYEILLKILLLFYWDYIKLTAICLFLLATWHAGPYFPHQALTMHPPVVEAWESETSGPSGKSQINCYS